MKLSDSEWTVMRAIWGAGTGSVTARQVHAVVEPTTAWSYSTVRTILSRLTEKRALDEGRRGKQLVYTARVDRDDARRSALRSLVDIAFGGRVGSLVQHLAKEESLTASERAEIEALMTEVAPRKSTRGRGSRGARGRRS